MFFSFVIDAFSRRVPGALDHELVAVVGQQADLHGRLVELGGSEPVGALPEDGSGDCAGIDPVGLAGFALSSARGAHH